MKRLRLTIAQINPVAGDIRGNMELLRDALAVAIEQGADVFLSPEKAVSGYPVEDLLGESAFLADCEEAVGQLCAAVPDGMLAAFGAPMREHAIPGRGGPTKHARLLDSVERDVLNVAALASSGTLLAAHSKALLPTYREFDDSRWVVAGPTGGQATFIVAGARVAVAICEDVWTPDVAADAKARGAELLLVPNASPFAGGKPASRLAMVTELAQRTELIIAYCNASGAQDEVVYDGGSFVVTPRGELLMVAPLFEAGTFTVDVPIAAASATAGDGDLVVTTAERAGRDPLPPVLHEWPSADEQMYTALVVGLRDYVHNNDFTDVILGLSGGLDSALAATIAVDALGAEHVHGLGLPGPYSSAGSVADAKALAQNLGIDFRVVSIRAAYEAIKADMGDLLEGPGGAVADQNVQARIRGAMLMNTSNAQGSMMVNTGNRSEAACGYFTLGADSLGGLAILKDVLKTQAYDLARWRNDKAARNGDTPPIPATTIDKPPSAELAPDQVDGNDLPPYPQLDFILQAYLDRMEPARVIAGGLAAQFEMRTPDAEAMTLRVLRMTDRAEHKRRQVAPGIQVGARPFGRARRMPITSRRQHHL